MREVVVVAPTSEDLVEVCATRVPGPTAWELGDRQRTERVRSALANSGFAPPTGRVRVEVIPDVSSYDHDLAVALAVLLCDPAHAHLRRDGWLAWGALRLDGTLEGAEAPLLNDLPQTPIVGRIWAPDDHLPHPDDDAVLSLVEVIDLRLAWDAVVMLTEMEGLIYDDDAPVASASSNGTA